ncbi:MAG: leucine-rich repeat protein [Eggerthellaceae bacterium]|nr:leucine-rich repeat protein [Eggerthellaceae bacterium]
MSEFEIVDGVLVKHNGWKKEVVIPKGVSEIGAMAFYECPPLERITIPEGVTAIGDWAFAGCKSLVSIHIPRSLISIGTGAFDCCTALKDAFFSMGTAPIQPALASIEAGAFGGCTALKNVFVRSLGLWLGISFADASSNPLSNKAKLSLWDRDNSKDLCIPGNVSEIKKYAFCGCKSLKSVTIEDGVSAIGRGAFEKCTALETVKIPDSVTTIGGDAFASCKSLKAVVIPASVVSIDGQAFQRCPGIVIYLRGGAIPEGFGLKDDQVLIAPEIPFEAIDEERIPKWSAGIGYMLAMKEGRKVNLDEAGRKYLRFNAGKIISSLNYDTGIVKAFCDNVLIYEAEARTLAAQFAEEGHAEAAAILKAFGGESTESEKAIEEARRSKEAGAVSEIVQPERETDVFAYGQLLSMNVPKTAKEAATTGVRYRDSDGICPKETLNYLISAYYVNLSRVNGTPENREGWENVPLNPEADRIAETLDWDSLSSTLLDLLLNKGKNAAVGAAARYANEADTAKLITRINAWTKGQRPERNLAVTARGALMLNTTKASMLYFEKKKLLSYYALKQGTTEEALRNKQLFDFGLDESGEKRYDLGNRTVLVRLTDTFAVELFDGESGKPIKSIPKTGADPERYENAKSDFAALKKNVKKAVQARVGYLKQCYLNGGTFPADEWVEANVSNPMLRNIARFIVWQQDGKTFTVKDGTLVDSFGRLYTLGTGKVAVAHPIEMDSSDISAWREYFIANNLEQPFVQVWEKVIDFRSFDSGRYLGFKIKAFRLLGHEDDGIRLVRGDYDEYGFAMLEIDGGSAQIRVEDGSWHGGAPADLIEIMSIWFRSRKTRMANHIVYYLDSCCLYQRIASNDITVMDDIGTPSFTTLLSYLNLAVESGATELGALLIEYRDKHFPEYDSAASLML